ncbi:MAG: RNA polymerase sigma factor [Limnochordia bacterium]
MAGPSDACLIQACLSGDTVAFATLILRHGEPVAALIRRRIPASDVEDVLQETLLSVWTHLGTLSDSGQLKAWLLQIARSRCSDYYRSPSRRDVPLEDDDLGHLVNRYGRAQPPDEGAEVHDALGRLSPPLQITARLFYLEDLSIAQISRQLQCPQGTVKRRLYSARNHLRQLLGDTPTKGESERE